MGRPWAMRRTERALALVLVTMSLATPSLAADGDAPPSEQPAAPSDSSAPNENATSEPEAAPPGEPSADAEAPQEPSPAAPESPPAEGAAQADTGKGDPETPAAATTAPAPTTSPEAEAEPSVEKESLSVVVQVGDVTLLIERPADEADEEPAGSSAAEVVVHVVATPQGGVDAEANEAAVSVDASLVVGLLDAIVRAADEFAPGADPLFDEAVATLRSQSASAEALWSVWDTGTLVIVLEPPTPTAPTGGGDAGEEGSSGDANGGDPCACQSNPDDEDQGSAWAPTQEATRTVARVRDAAYGEVSWALDELTRRLPLGPTPSAPSMPPQRVPQLQGDAADDAPSGPAPTTSATAFAAQPAMPLAAKAAIATMALASVAVPLAAGGNASPLGLHKLLAALRRLVGWALGVPLYAKLRREQVLTHPVREHILALVQAEPGIHAQRLRRELDLGWGTLAHHMRVLQSWGLVVVQRDGNKAKAFPSQWSPAERTRAAALANPGTSQVYAAIAQRPGAEQRQVAAAVGRSHPTVIWHAERLEKAGLIRVERRGRRTAYFATAPADVTMGA